MKAGKLRGIIGNGLILLFSICTLGFMALPMLSVSSTSQSLGSVFDYMGEASSINNAKYQTAVAFFIIVAIIACVLMITSIIGLVAAIISNKKLNMTLVNRIVTGVMAVFSLIALIVTVAFTGDTIGIVVNAGAIMPLIFSLFTVAGAIIAPSKKKA